jgi:CDP-glycerol glycerophosphotransferase (TagB/SpsB family)
VGVYFADTRVNLYQIRQWYAPLAELAKHRGVAIIARSPGSYVTLRAESPVPVLYLRTVTDIEGFLEQQDLAAMLYVNQNIKNFQMFRYGRMWHVFINHGESDKIYMTSNQYKAYDYAFVAGQAALDRLGRKLWNYDVANRAIPIGRPQADHLDDQLPFQPNGRTVVFYAPTWEGDRPTMAYGSIASHGVALAEAVLASPGHRLIYRPHPRSGVNSREYREANEQIQRMIAAADPAAGHLFDEGGELGWQIAVADVQVTDISAMVYDRLATGKPLVVTRPASATAQVDESGFLGSAEWMSTADLADPLGFLDRAINDETARSNLAFWANHHFGDTTPGSATARFHAAIDTLVERWEEQDATHEREARVEHDALDDEDDSDDESVPPPD